MSHINVFPTTRDAHTHLSNHISGRLALPVPQTPPPTFVGVAKDDDVTGVAGPTALFKALREREAWGGNSSEATRHAFHIFSTGGHACTTCDQHGRSHGTTCGNGQGLGCVSDCCGWPKLVLNWLKAVMPAAVSLGGARAWMWKYSPCACAVSIYILTGQSTDCGGHRDRRSVCVCVVAHGRLWSVERGAWTCVERQRFAKTAYERVYTLAEIGTTRLTLGSPRAGPRRSPRCPVGSVRRARARRLTGLTLTAGRLVGAGG
eukprot:2357702-Prymnesium_polylepis.2